jgi:hypothetical protein
MFDLDAIHLEYVTDSVGKKRAVILPIAAFHELLADLADLAAVVERASEPTLAHQKLITELRADGLLSASS